MASSSSCTLYHTFLEDTSGRSAKLGLSRSWLVAKLLGLRGNHEPVQISPMQQCGAGCIPIALSTVLRVPSGIQIGTSKSFLRLGN